MQKTAGELVPEETGAHHLRHTFARRYLAQRPHRKSVYVCGQSKLSNHLANCQAISYTNPCQSARSSEGHTRGKN